MFFARAGAVIVFGILALSPIHQTFASQEFGELSIMGSFSKTDYGNGAYSNLRRYSASLGVNVTSTTEVEVSFSVTDTYFYSESQTTSVNEQALGLSLVQTLVPRYFYIQPYIKGGGAQYNREQSGTILGAATTPSKTKSPSGLLGAGIRVFLLRNFSVKVEGVTYLPDFTIAEAKNNFAVQGGLGWSF